MSEEFFATMLRDRAVQYLLEGGDVDAAQWLKESPLLAGEGRRLDAERVQIFLTFGCSRRNMETFEHDAELRGPLTDLIYTAFRAVTSPMQVDYVLELRYLPPEELADVTDELVFELEQKT
jgi:hypothetical protein